MFISVRRLCSCKVHEIIHTQGTYDHCVTNCWPCNQADSTYIHAARKPASAAAVAAQRSCSSGHMLPKSGFILALSSNQQYVCCLPVDRMPRVASPYMGPTSCTRVGLGSVIVIPNMTMQGINP